MALVVALALPVAFFPRETVAQTTAPAPLLPGQQVPQPVLPGQEAPQPGTALPAPNMFPDNPSMSLNPDEALGAAAQPGAAQTAPKTKEELDAAVRKEAFDAALQGVLPMKPDEIRSLLEKFDRTQESVETPIYPAPKPVVAVETVSLDPGTKPVVVKVAYGNVSTLNVLDTTGAPWPIEDISWAGNFEVITTAKTGTIDGEEQAKRSGLHIIRITPQSEFATGNMSIRLVGLQTPVIISLETSRDIVHYRFDAIIPETGPLAEAPLIDTGLTLQAGEDESIGGILQGRVPGNAEKLAVTGDVDGRTSAYKLKGQTYLRTPLTLLSPGWSSSTASADGMRVYVIKGAPVLLFSDKGKMIRARLSARKDIIEDAAR